MNYYNTSSGLGSGCITIIILFMFLLSLNTILAWVCELLWNWLAPLFWANAPILTYWQAFGVFVLISIISSLFKSSK